MTPYSLQFLIVTFPLREYVHLYITRRKSRYNYRKIILPNVVQSGKQSRFILQCVQCRQRSGRPRNFCSIRGRDERTVCFRKRPDWPWCPRRHLFIGIGVPSLELSQKIWKGGQENNRVILWVPTSYQ